MTNSSTSQPTSAFNRSTSSSVSQLYDDVILKKETSTAKTDSSNVVHFPNPYLGKSGTKTGESRIQIVTPSNTTVPKLEPSYEELVEYLQKATEIAGTLNKVGTYTNYELAGGFHNDENNKIKEAEDKVYKVQKKLNLFKYYSFIWMFSIALIALFLILGLLEVLAFFPSFTGILASIIGAIGAYLDWKSKERQYDS